MNRFPPPVGFTLALALVALAGMPSAAAAQDTDAALEIGLGSNTYRTYCASCHGRDLEGGGPVAEVLKVPPADLTRIAARREGEFPHAEIHAIIDGRRRVAGHGSPDMPVWGDVFRSIDTSATPEDADRRIAALVRFLESQQE